MTAEWSDRNENSNTHIMLITRMLHGICQITGKDATLEQVTAMYKENPTLFTNGRFFTNKQKYLRVLQAIIT